MKRELLNQILSDRAAKIPVAVVTFIDGGAQHLVYPDRSSADLSEEIIGQARQALHHDRSGIHESSGGKVFIQVFNPPLRLIVVGAVHITQALVPVASQPGPMSGRNWIQRRINVEAIRNDPEWKGGDYETPPTNWVRVAPLSALMTQSVVRIQEMAPTREKGDALYRQFVERAQKADANNRLYQIEATMDYDPTPLLGKIRARLLAINFADDAINPPELGVLEAGVARIPGARSVIVPAGPQSQGHYTSMRAALWKQHLAEFLT